MSLTDFWPSFYVLDDYTVMITDLRPHRINLDNIVCRSCGEEIESGGELWMERDQRFWAGVIEDSVSPGYCLDCVAESTDVVFRWPLVLRTNIKV